MTLGTLLLAAPAGSGGGGSHVSTTVVIVIVIVAVLGILAVIGWRSGGPAASKIAREAQREKDANE